MTPPQPGEVQIWAINVADPPRSMAALHGLLTAEEQRRADRYHRPADRRRAVVGRGVLRVLLGDSLGRPPAALKFELAEHGKPVLQGVHGGGVEFNVSHSGDWVLIALSGAPPVGIDVEQIRPIRDLDALAARYFAPDEARTIRSLPAAERTEAFFLCWTRKEAVIKAVGMGLQMDLDRFSVSLARDTLPAVISIDGSRAAAGAWTLLDAAPSAGYAAAVAVARRGVRATLRYWSGTTGIATQWDGSIRAPALASAN